MIALVVVGVSALAAIVLAAPGGGTADSERRFEGSVLPPGLRAPDFALPDQDGKRVTMRSLRGRPVIVTFMYSTCKDTCPTQAQQVRAALEELGRDVPALAVAVDPPRDNARSARTFLAQERLTGRMTFVLGRRDQLKPVWKGFGVQPQRAGLGHTSRVVLVDARGVQRVSFPLDQVTPERVAHDLRLLLQGS